MAPPYLIPSLSDEDLQIALKKAGRALTPRRAAALKRRVNTALSNYAIIHLGDRLRHATTPSELRVRLSQIERAAVRSAKQKVTAMFGDPAYVAAVQELRRLAIVRALPVHDLGHDLEALRSLSRDAGLLVARRIECAKSQAATGKLRERRHRGNESMLALIGTLNCIWAFYFRELPGITQGRREPGGPYARFVCSLLKAFARRLGADIQRDFPGFRNRLLLSPQALRGYFRRTGISVLRTFDS